MTEAQWVNLAVQLPFVALIVYLWRTQSAADRADREKVAAAILDLDARHREERKERDGEWRSWLAAQRTEYLAAITTMATDFRAFAVEQRTIFAQKLKEQEDNTEHHLERMLAHIDTVLERRRPNGPRSAT